MRTAVPSRMPRLPCIGREPRLRIVLIMPGIETCRRSRPRRQVAPRSTQGAAVTASRSDTADPNRQRGLEAAAIARPPVQGFRAGDKLLDSGARGSPGHRTSMSACRLALWEYRFAGSEWPEYHPGPCSSQSSTRPVLRTFLQLLPAPTSTPRMSRWSFLRPRFCCG